MLKNNAILGKMSDFHLKKKLEKVIWKSDLDFRSGSLKKWSKTRSKKWSLDHDLDNVNSKTFIEIPKATGSKIRQLFSDDRFAKDTLVETKYEVAVLLLSDLINHNQG